MLHQINGLHHVTSLASSASENNTFFSEGLGLRRIKATVNFDNPEVYHLYYGQEQIRERLVRLQRQLHQFFLSPLPVG